MSIFNVQNMVVSSSHSSSSEDESPIRKTKEDKSSSSSDFEETRPILKEDVKSPNHLSSSNTSKQKTPVNVNANVLAAIGKGTSIDFMSKMNAAMLRNLPTKSPVPPKKLNRIGFDNDQSSSSDNKKSSIKNTTQNQIASRKSSSSEESSSDEKESNAVIVSPIKTALLTKTKDVSSSESDSEKELNAKKAMFLENCQKNKSSSEGSDSDSSDSEKNHGKVVKQVSFSESTSVDEVDRKPKSTQIKTPQKSSNVSSDTDSDDDIKAKRIEEIKQELKMLQTFGKRQKNICGDSKSTEDGKSKRSKYSTSSDGTRTIQNVTNTNDSSSSDDEKITSILTQRETPKKKSHNKSSSASNSDSESDAGEDAFKNVTKSSALASNKLENINESDDPHEDSALKRDKLFSEFLSEHPDYREVKIKSAFNSSTLSKHDEIYTCTVPKHIPSDLLRNKEFSLDELTTFNFGPDKYNIKSEQFKSKKQSLCLINKNNNNTFVTLDVKGQIKVLKASSNIKIYKEINLEGVTSDKKVVVPELKQRHPIFGADLSKIILNKTVQNRLDTMIEDLNRKISKSKKKKSNLDKDHDGGDGQIIKEDIYKMLNFLQESSVVGDKNDFNVVENNEKNKKSWRKSQNTEEEQTTFTKNVDDKEITDETLAEPPTKKSRPKDQGNPTPKKNKKSKLKLNLPEDIETDIELDIQKTRPEKSSKKSKKRAVLANSTFASPSLNANPQLFVTNESIIPAESSEKQKHSKKHLKKLMKTSVLENNSNATNPLKTKGSKTEPDEPAISLKHLEKLIKNVAKERDTDIINSSYEQIASKDTDDIVPITKKKKKKNKDKTKEK